MFVKKLLLASPRGYHHLRNIITGGLPLRRWAEICGLGDPTLRVADLGCGPCDILDYLPAGGRPSLYVGIDYSEVYLEAARKRAEAAGVTAEFIAMDLTRLTEDAAAQQALVDTLESRQISRVLLIGVIHHLDDRSAAATLEVVRRSKTVRSVVTTDVVKIPGRWINNWFCRRDRGQFVREEAGYDALMAASGWPQSTKVWTAPGIRSFKFLHYVLSK
jgi:SAM-dependent methyltransferase